MRGDIREARRILIVRLSALGDVVHVLPTLDAIRRARPDAHVGWVVEPQAASLLEGHPQLDRVHVFDRPKLARLLGRGRLIQAWRLVRDLRRSLRAERYELALELQGNARSSSVALLSGAPRRLGYPRGHTKEWSHLLTTRHVRVPKQKLLKVEKAFLFLEALGIDAGGARARVGVPEPANEKARAFYEGLGPGPRVVLHPGVSAFGAFKQWMPERFAALARRLASERGATPVVTWGPGERELAEAVARGSEGSATIAPETASLKELIALLTAADVVVGADTGPVHLAAALGVPSVALFGPKDPEVYRPWSPADGPAAVTIWKGVHCSPCGLRRCDDVICMPAIEVSDAFDAVARLLPSRPEVTA